MSSNLTQWTDRTPSRFGMPMSGSAYATARIDGTSAPAATRDHRPGGVARRVKGDFLRTVAWRPPSC